MKTGQRIIALIAAAGASQAVAGPSVGDMFTHQIPMANDVPLGIFGVVWQFDWGVDYMPLVVREVRLNANFNTESTVRNFHEAADILFQLQLPTTNVPFWDVAGEDLGWSGTGAFSGSLSTNAFDGEVFLPPPIPGEINISNYFRRIVSRDDNNQLLGGILTDSYWEVDVEVIPTPATLALAPLLLLPSRRRR